MDINMQVDKLKEESKYYRNKLLFCDKGSHKESELIGKCEGLGIAIKIVEDEQ